MTKKFIPVSIVLVITEVSKDGFSLWMQKRKENLHHRGTPHTTDGVLTSFYYEAERAQALDLTIFRKSFPPKGIRSRLLWPQVGSQPVLPAT